MTTGVLLPCHDAEPVERVEFDAGDTAALHRHIGGYFETIAIERPPAMLWCHEEGKLLELPFNRRASLLLWMHAPQFRNLDVLVGNVLVTGVADDAGDTTDIPAGLAALLLSGRRVYEIKVQADGNGKWYGNCFWYERWDQAYESALRVALHGKSVRDVRVLPPDPPTLRA